MKRSLLEIDTNGDNEIVDLTERVGQLVREHGGDGVVHLFVVGSTAAITTVEYEPGLVRHDIAAALEKLAPVDGRYQHEETWNDDNGHAHVRATIIGPDLSAPFERGRLLTGTYQQLVLIDFDTRPRRRRVIVTILD